MGMDGISLQKAGEMQNTYKKRKKNSLFPFPVVGCLPTRIQLHMQNFV